MIYPRQYNHPQHRSNHLYPVHTQPIRINQHQHTPIQFKYSHVPATQIYPHRNDSQSSPMANNIKLKINTPPLRNIPSLKPQQIQLHLPQAHRQNIAVQSSSAIPQALHLPPKTRVEYVPYEQRFIDYVEQRVRVPVQKVRNDYYQVEHIVDYMPIAKQEIVYVTEPQQTVSMRLQYIPVEQRIIHIKEEDAKQLRLNSSDSMYNNSVCNNNYQIQHLPVTFNPADIKNQQYYTQQPIELKPSKTNYVTSEGYDPNQRIREIDRVLAQSTRRQYMEMQPNEYRQPQPNYKSGINILESIAAGVGNLIDKDKQVQGSSLSQNKQNKQSNIQGENILKSIAAGLGHVIKNQTNSFNTNNNNTSYNNNPQNNNHQNTFGGNWFNHNHYGNSNHQQEHNNAGNSILNSVAGSLGDIIKKNSQNTSSNPEIDICQLPQNKKGYKKHSNPPSINQEDQYKRNGQQILDSIAGGLGDLIKGRPLSTGNSNYFQNPFGSYQEHRQGN